MMEAPLDQLSLKTSQEGGSAQPSSAEYNDEPADELIESRVTSPARSLPRPSPALHTLLRSWFYARTSLARFPSFLLCVSLLISSPLLKVRAGSPGCPERARNDPPAPPSHRPCAGAASAQVFHSPLGAPRHLIQEHARGKQHQPRAQSQKQTTTCEG